MTRVLDQQVLSCGERLYNANNLKLARYKEIFPAPAKTETIDTRRMLELFALDGQRALAGVFYKRSRRLVRPDVSYERLTNDEAILIRGRNRQRGVSPKPVFAPARGADYGFR